MRISITNCRRSGRLVAGLGIKILWFIIRLIFDIILLTITSYTVRVILQCGQSRYICRPPFRTPEKWNLLPLTCAINTPNHPQKKKKNLHTYTLAHRGFFSGGGFWLINPPMCAATHTAWACLIHSVYKSQKLKLKKIKNLNANYKNFVYANVIIGSFFLQRSRFIYPNRARVRARNSTPNMSTRYTITEIDYFA